MGWCQGTELAEEIYDIVRKYIPEKERKKIAARIYKEFCEHDADSWEDTDQIIIDGEIK